MKTDSQIQEDVMRELRWDPSISHEHIGVAVENGIVTLSGKVPNFIEKTAAENATQRVAGVKAVVEKIEVVFPSSLPYRPTDQDIAKSILDLFRWNAQIPDEKIKVSVSNGWVTLTGEVEWAYQKLATQQAVRTLTGVRGISNNVVIKPRVQATDVKVKIEEALKRAAEREAKHIDIAVSGGRVILSGKVRSFAELQSARGAAWNAPGVTSVESHLTVGA